MHVWVCQQVDAGTNAWVEYAGCQAAAPLRMSACVCACLCQWVDAKTQCAGKQHAPNRAVANLRLRRLRPRVYRSTGRGSLWAEGGVELEAVVVPLQHQQAVARGLEQQAQGGGRLVVPGSAQHLVVA